MALFKSGSTLLLGAFLLAGCASPFAQRTGYDFGVSNAPGTIVLGHPRMSSREDLVNSRARDTAWFQRLIAEVEDPEKVQFTPQIIRDVEIVQAMAFALGLRFDPAAGAAARRNADTTEALYQIDKMKLDFAIEQLKKDIDLQRAKFAEQTEPINTGLGIATGSAGAAPSPAVGALDQLKTAVGKLETAVTARFDVDGKGPLPTTAKSSPLEDFRDRLATREAYQSALNAANLDQLHDAGGARLMRINTELNVTPVPNYLRSLGVLEATIIPPASGSLTERRLERWLVYLNSDGRYRQSGTLTNHRDLDDLVASERFERVPVGAVELMLPIVYGDGERLWKPGAVIRRAQWDNDGKADDLLFAPALSLLSGVDTGRTAAVLNAICTGAVGPDGTEGVEHALFVARDRDLTAGYFRIADKVARAAASPLASPWTVEAEERLESASRYREAVTGMMAANTACTSYLATLSGIPEWKAFRDIASNKVETRVYQVGPRELVQQVSTLARNASTIGLSISGGGSDPSSGIAAEAAASYQRQAIGRASALERVRLVSGHAVGGQPMFRWVVGPRALIDAKGRIDMEHVPDRYDVWVDLSVPGWWAGFDLEARTAWAPSPQLLAAGSLKSILPNPSQIVPVRLVDDESDYGALTDLILGSLHRRLEITGVEGGPVNACTPTTLWVQGDSLWRAESVFVMGQLLKREAFSVTSDMKGLYVTVPAITAPPNVNLSQTLMVMTPSRPMVWGRPVPYLASPSGEECKPKPAAATAAADAVAIGDIKPALEFVVPGRFTVHVSGANLKKVARVELHGQAGALKVAADGKSLEVAFDETMTSAIPGSDNTTLEFLDSGRKSLGLKRVRTQRAN